MKTAKKENECKLVIATVKKGIPVRNGSKGKGKGVGKKGMKSSIVDFY